MYESAAIADRLDALAAELRAASRASDWVDAEHELLTVAEVSIIGNISGETARRWAADYRLGRLFAGSLWLVSYARLLRHIERRSGRAAMLDARRRADEMFRSSLSVPHLSTRMLVAATS